jgi:malate dehydrogenase (oxaloacetate-decarboxylating)(NADP+)
MVTGVTRTYDASLEDIQRVIDPARFQRVIGMSIVLAKGRTIFIADTNITELPEADELAQIAVQAAKAARRFGVEPKLAFISYSTFGNPAGERMEKMRDAVSLLDRREDVDFVYEGEMSVEVALNPEAHRLYPFSRLTEPANVLIMPAIHSASISTKLLATLGGATVIGPLLIGLDASIQIAPLSATVSDLVTLATMAAYDLNPKPKA